MIHVEPQSYFQKEFHERMFIYCSRLYEKYRKPILPIAIFSYNDKRKAPAHFTMKTPTFTIIEFHYLQLHLIQMNWHEYLRKDNPVAAALLSKMGYRNDERIRVKLEFLRMLSRMQLNPAKMELIYGFFETYLKLNEEEEKQMREEITKLPQHEVENVLKLPNSYFEKGVETGIKKGIQKGIQKGIEKTKQEIAVRMLEKNIDAEIISEITGLKKEEILKLKG